MQILCAQQYTTVLSRSRALATPELLSKLDTFIQFA